MSAISQPSEVVVTGPATLAQNFGENSKNFLCQLTFGTGAYAIGGRILGVAKFTPQTALVTSGALLAALALCPSGASQNAIVGVPSELQGGQCPVVYQVVLNYVFNADIAAGNPGIPQTEIVNAIGPLSIRKLPDSSSAGRFFYQLVNGAGNIPWQFQLNPSKGDQFSVSVSRTDGGPDNCGSLPNEGGQLIQNTQNGDVINGDTIIDNSTEIGIAPITVNMGGINTTFDVSFGDIQIHAFAPFTYTVVIGGTRWGFRLGSDGNPEPFPVNPDPELPVDQEDSWRKVIDKLEEIRACVCQGESPVFKADLLDYLDLEDCLIKKQQVFFPENEELNPIISRFIASAVAAERTCSEQFPEQLEETIIFAATTLEDGREIFTGKIGPEVVSLRLKILEFVPGLSIPISTYPAANQFKFGSVSFTSENNAGGGDYLYVFDENTYIPLPRRGKPGRLRLLLKERISFEVYDTGERL